MYTSCPECGTVFRISTNDLRMAEGYVRCGHCSATFNAIETLTEEPPPTVTLRHLELPTEPQPGEPEGAASASDAPAESVPGFPAEPPAIASPPELQAAATFVPLPVSDDTLEFDIPEDSWSNFFDADAGPPLPALEPEPFIETEAQTETKTESEPEEFEEPESVPEPEPAARDVGTGIGSDTVDQAGLYRALSAETGEPLDDDADWHALLAEVKDDDVTPQPVYVIGEGSWDEPSTDAASAPAPLPWDFAPVLAEKLTMEPAGDLGPVPAGRPATGAADRPFIWEPPAPPPAESRHQWRYVAGSTLAALLLIIQLLHQQRDELATHPTLTEPLQRTYAALGLPLWPAWDLRAYELRGSEAVADRSSPGALDILGRIAVVGSDRVGLPLVRVTLRDRFGQPLGSRVFKPAEYMTRNAPLREPVSPGTLIPVEISLKDPGRDAQGFDVDICLMSRRDGITCRGDREPFAR